MSTNNLSSHNSSPPLPSPHASSSQEETVPIVVLENLERATPTRNGKKKYEFFLDDPEDNSSVVNLNADDVMQDHSSGLAFVGSFGQLDCSIGTIFQDDFRKTLEQLKSDENKNHALSVLIVDDSVIQRKLSQKVLGGMIDEVMWMV